VTPISLEMRRIKSHAKLRNLLVAVMTALALFYFNHDIGSKVKKFWKNNKRGGDGDVESTIHIAVVSCAKVNYLSNRETERAFSQSITMMKSATLFSSSQIHFHIFTEDDMKILFLSELESWPAKVKERVSFTVRNVDYDDYLPEELRDEFKKWYKPCGSFRLFLPMVLHTVADAAIYCDSDVIFVKPVEQLWSHLRSFERTQVMAIAPTSGHPLGGSDDNENMIKHPSGMFQINSGILLMNFKKMLTTNWALPAHGGGGGSTEVESSQQQRTLTYGSKLLLWYYRVYKEKAEHDQKLLNIMFHYNPELIRKLSCKWNFKNNFCQNDANTCPDAEREGAAAVHGITSAFFGNVQPTFQALFEAVLEYNLEDDVPKLILDKYHEKLRENTATSSDYCFKKSGTIIVEPLTQSIKDITDHKVAVPGGITRET